MASFGSYGVGEWAVTLTLPDGAVQQARFETEAEAQERYLVLQEKYGKRAVDLSRQKGVRSVNISDVAARKDGA